MDKDKNYSEWSTVCLIKGIHKATIRVPLFEDSNDIGDMVINIGTLDINAVIEPMNKTIDAKEQFNENIYYYEMYIYKNEAVYEYSGKIYTTDENERNLKYTFKKQLEVNQAYELEILFCTTSNYIQSEKYEFVYSLIEQQMKIDIHLQENDEEGYIETAISTKDLIPGFYILLRASSLDNFTTWKDIHLFQKGIDEYTKTKILKEIQNESFMSANDIEEIEGEFYTFRDYTIQGGVLYKYKIQNYGKGGIRSLKSETSEAALCYFDHMFLGDKNFQLKIKFDGSLSSPKKNILESKIDTIGGKYPIIRRNSSVQYESFQISGIISTLGDENEFYDSSWKEDEEWKKQYYNKYNISNMRDFVGEKTYRDKVIDFLHDGQVKLFRSMQEGNFLVRLMDISFTPNQQLGRLIGSFQATAYQIADLTIENYFKYNILDNIIYNENQDIISTETVFGQYNTKEPQFLSTLKNILNESRYKQIYNYNNYQILTFLNKINKIEIIPSEDCRIFVNGKIINLYQNKPVTFSSKDVFGASAFNGVINYEAEIQIQYKQNAFKTQYISTNIGQTEILENNENLINTLIQLYNKDIEELYFQEIEEIKAIEFYNFENDNIKIYFNYSDEIITFIELRPNEKYVLLSDMLKTKGINSIYMTKESEDNIPIKKANVVYYYTLSKKYYFKED